MKKDMNLSDLISPISEGTQMKLRNNDIYSLGTHLTTKRNSLENASIVLIGIDEYRNSINYDGKSSLDFIRKYLYGLNRISEDLSIIDLGDIKRGKTVYDTYCAVRELMVILNRYKAIPIFLGGTQDLTIPIFRSLFDVSNPKDLISIDSRIDWNHKEELYTNKSYLNGLSSDEIAHTVHIAFQNYFVDNTVVDHFVNNKARFFRLGKIRSSMEEVEVFFRDALLISFDFGSLRTSEAPGAPVMSPNGLLAHEACQLAWYAGMSNNKNSFALFDYDGAKDPSELGASLAAQIVWHFIYGTFNKIDDKPTENNEDVQCYRIDISELSDTIKFFQNTLTNRWWVEIPFVEKNKMFSCSLNDYRLAVDNQVSDRVWQIIERYF